MNYYKLSDKKQWIIARRSWYLRFGRMHFIDEADRLCDRRKKTKRAIADYYKFILNEDRFSEWSWKIN